MGTDTPFDEFTADPDLLCDAINGKSHEGTTTFNPVVDRHLRYQADHSLRDIKAGEEVLDNYLAFVGIAEDWKNDVQQMRKVCAGQEVGEVTSYETDASSELQ